MAKQPRLEADSSQTGESALCLLRKDYIYVSTIVREYEGYHGYLTSMDNNKHNCIAVSAEQDLFPTNLANLKMADKVESKRDDTAVAQQEDPQTENTSDSDSLPAIIKMVDEVESKRDDTAAVAQQEDPQTENTSDSDSLPAIIKYAKLSKPYFKVRVLISETNNPFCYLSTMDNYMAYNPEVGDGNKSLIWVLKEHTEDGRMHWFISNVVTDQSNSRSPRTYMNLREGVGGPDNANYIVLLGPKTKMYFEEMPREPNKIAIYTYPYPDSQTKAYLQPLPSDSQKVIVAKVEEKPSYFFKIKHTSYDC